MTLACAASDNFSWAVFRTEGGERTREKGKREEINRAFGERAPV